MSVCHALPRCTSTLVPRRLYGTYFFRMSIEGYLAFTARLTLACSPDVPCAATIASANRACAMSWMGYARLLGRANDVAFSFFLAAAVSFAIWFPEVRVGHQDFTAEDAGPPL